MCVCVCVCVCECACVCVSVRVCVLVHNKTFSMDDTLRTIETVVSFVERLSSSRQFIMY